MSKAISPTAIGGFTVGALALLVAGLLLFGGGQAFNNDGVRFVVFLNSSLNGLDVGAPVKMQGVKVGEVKEIALLFDHAGDKLYKPVVIEINRSLLSGTGGDLPGSLKRDELAALRDRLVAAGFRARLEMQSLLTGLLYVDLDVHPDKPPMFADLEYRGLLEMPGIPATSDELRDTAEQVAQKIRTLPLDQIAEDLADNLHEIKQLLASEDLKKTQVSLANTLQELEKTIGILNRNLEPLLQHSQAAVASSELLLKDSRRLIQQVDNALPQLVDNTGQALQAATSTLRKVEDSMQQIDQSMGADSVLTDALRAFEQAARSIRELGDYLERHPEAVLSGKAQ